MKNGRHKHHHSGIRPAIGLLLALAAGALAAEFPQGLTLHFGFDEASSVSQVPDKAGRGNGGRATGLKWTSAGKQAGAAEFAGNDSFIVVTNAPALNATQQTFAAWFKTARTGAAERCLLDKVPASGYALSVAGSADEKRRGRLRFVVNGHECLSDAAVNDGAWHHGAATYDGQKMRLYVDGQLQKQVPELRGAITANTNELSIGMHRSSATAQEKGLSFGGILDEVMIFNHAISADQVQAVMAAAKPKFSQAEVTRRLAELKELLDRGLILPEFYARKVKECETSQ